MSEQKQSKKVKNRGRNWQAIAKGRASIPHRDIRTTRGLTNIPKITETGSAAYRRMAVKNSKKGTK